MGRWLYAAAGLAALGSCGRSTPPVAPAAAPEAPPPAVPETPDAAYASCRERVEGPEAAGECDADADCGKTGCGGEVCTTTAEIPNVMTTCEDRACFAVLETCGCHGGRCTWTVRPAEPAAPQ